MTTDVLTPQDDVALGADGGTQPASDDLRADDQPGAETTKEEAKTFTQTQVSAMQSESDQTISNLRKGAAQYALNEEIRNAQATEVTKATADSRLVADGMITEGDAANRAVQRQKEASDAQAQRESISQDLQAHAALLVEGNQLGRYVEAHKLAKELKLTSEEADALEADVTITSKDQMRLRAERLSMDKEKKGNEKFDSGQVGSKGASVDQMSSQEKIAHGLKGFA
jgi:predicted HNH restriction endonuclease